MPLPQEPLSMVKTVCTAARLKASLRLLATLDHHPQMADAVVSAASMIVLTAGDDARACHNGDSCMADAQHMRVAMH